MIPQGGYDNYEYACEAILTREEALAQVRQHQVSVDEFLQDVGDKPYYRGKEVLDWLGY